MLKAKHQQLFDILREEFLRGEWPEGTKLPKLKDLTEQYSVSINIASKAVDLLKEAGLVEAKVGDGIYSTYKKHSSINTFHYAGDRIFGRYQGAKILNILVEDSSNVQMEFWNKFFQDFSSRNPDIELNINYQAWVKNKNAREYEAVIGGYSFIRQMIHPNDKGLSPECVKTFLPNLFDGCIFDENQFPGYLPFGYNASLLLAQSGCRKPENGENILDYTESLQKKKQNYVLRTGRMLLASMDIDIKKLGTDEFTQADASKMLSVFERSRQLYRTGSLKWFHGKFIDTKQLIDLLFSKKISVMEIQSNILNGFSLEKNIKILPFPYGKKPSISTHFVHISQNTLYPEEYLRLVKNLLSEEVQKNAEKLGVFYTLNKDCESIAPGNLRKELLKKNVHFHNFYTEAQAEAFYSFLGWEFFYYLEGKRDSEVIDLIHKKVRYFYEKQNKNNLEKKVQDLPFPESENNNVRLFNFW